MSRDLDPRGGRVEGGPAPRPTLVTVARGAGSGEALVARAVAVQAARRLGGDVRRLACTLGAPDDPRAATRVVPALLDRGHEVVVVPVGLGADALTDLDELAASVGPTEAARLRVTPAPGAHPLLVEALNRQVAAAGARPTGAVVLATGRGGPLLREARTCAALLQARRGGEVVQVAAVDGLPGGIGEAVLALRRRRTGRVVVAPFALGPGPVAQRARALAEVSGADGVAQPLGAHRLLVELVARRYLVAARTLRPLPVELARVA